PFDFSIWLPHWGWFLLATVVLVVGYVGLSVWLPWHREQQVVREVEGWGGKVFTETSGPEWLRQLVGKDQMQEFKVFERVIIVDLALTTISDATLDHLTGLTNLPALALSG